MKVRGKYDVVVCGGGTAGAIAAVAAARQGAKTLVFGDDPAVYHHRSPITHAAGSRVPTMIVIAEFESPLLDVYALDLFHAMSRAAPPELRLVCMDRHNHTSIIAHFNTSEEILGDQILDFMASIPARPQAGA